MIRLEAATVMLQWSVGGLAFLWFTTRRNEVGPGYAMLLRGTYGVFAVIVVLLGNRYGLSVVRELSGAAVAVAALNTALPTVVPPKLSNAVSAVEAPVPPCAIARSFVKVSVPIVAVEVSSAVI